MKLVIITDTHSFNLKLIDDVLRSIAYDPSSDAIRRVVFYGRTAYDTTFPHLLKRSFRDMDFSYKNKLVPVRPGTQPNWRSIIREEVRDNDYNGFMLTIVVSECFHMLYYNFIHTDLFSNIVMTRCFIPAFTDVINFTRVDDVGHYFSDLACPSSSISIYAE